MDQQRSDVLRAAYDVVVCGSGSSGSVVARRLSDDPAVQVLLIEAGGDDDVPEVMDPTRWMDNLGTERDWGFTARPSQAVAGRRIGMSMGKLLGGGSSINVAVWARGHRDDWDFFAEHCGDPAWGYEAVLGLYRRIEDWKGEPDPHRRGTGGPVQVSPVPLRPLGQAAVAAFVQMGVPDLGSWNGATMEAPAATGTAETTVQEQGRQSIYRDYVHPVLGRPNLTVLTGATVGRVLVEDGRASGVEIRYRGATVRVGADLEVVLSLGAIESPKVLMQSGIGDERHLGRFGIPVVQHLPGVGANLQDHVLATAGVWQSPLPLEAGPIPQAGTYLSTDPTASGPNVQHYQYEGWLGGVTHAQVDLPDHPWCVFTALVRPHSRGRVSLTGADPSAPVDIDGCYLREQADVDALVAGVEGYREAAATTSLAPYACRQVFPVSTDREQVAQMLRRTAVSYWHQSGTNAMGRHDDPASVVDASLAVHGVAHLRVADASIMPRITTGNTMAPCVVIGERAADILRAEHGSAPAA